MDVTFQNLDSSEISLTDVSHYFDNDPTKVVGNLRKDYLVLLVVLLGGSVVIRALLRLMIVG